MVGRAKFATVAERPPSARDLATPLGRRSHRLLLVFVPTYNESSTSEGLGGCGQRPGSDRAGRGRRAPDGPEIATPG